MKNLIPLLESLLKLIVTLEADLQSLSPLRRWLVRLTALGLVTVFLFLFCLALWLAAWTVAAMQLGKSQ